MLTFNVKIVSFFGPQIKFFVVKGKIFKKESLYLNQLISKMYCDGRKSPTPLFFQILFLISIV